MTSPIYTNRLIFLLMTCPIYTNRLYINNKGNYIIPISFNSHFVEYRLQKRKILRIPTEIFNKYYSLKIHLIFEL